MDFLVKINLEKRPTYQLDDFNIDLSKYGKDPKTEKFLNLLLSHGFYPRIDRPARITESTATLIDHIFVNVHTGNIVSGPWLVNISDHLLICTTLLYENSAKIVKAEYITKRRYDEKSMLAFRDELSTVDWSLILLNECINNKSYKFISTFDNLYTKHYPPKKIKIRNDKAFKPWITRAIRNSIKKKNNLY